jgi:hypothetical protein
LSVKQIAGDGIRLSGFVFDIVEDVCGIEFSATEGGPRSKPLFTGTTDWEPYQSPNDGPYASPPDFIKAYAMTLTVACREYNGVLVLHCAPENEPHHVSDFVAWLQWLRAENGVERGHYPPGMYSDDRPFLSESADEEVLAFAMRYNQMVFAYMASRKLMRSRKGYLASGPQNVRQGDLICIVYGGALPLILRPRDGGFTFVGVAYVHGVMHGEGLAMSEADVGCQQFDIF